MAEETELEQMLHDLGLDVEVWEASGPLAEGLWRMAKDLRDRPGQKLLYLRTGELVTEDELTRRAEAQRAEMAGKKVRGMRAQLVVVDEWVMDSDGRPDR